MKYGKTISCVAAGVLAPSMASAFLLDDGSFDNATSGTQTSGSAWVLTTNFPDGTDPAARFQTGFGNAENTGAGGPQSPGTGAGIWFRSFEGEQGGDMSQPKAQSDVAQSVVAAAAGDYTLSFVAGREVNMTAGAFSVSLTSSGTGGSASVDLLTATIPDGNLGGGASPNAGGTPFSITLTGVSAGDTLSVVGSVVDGMDSLIPGGQSGFLDSFRLVPEPASVGVLGAAGLMLLRRRK